jgi:predicted transcriptional regulator
MDKIFSARVDESVIRRIGVLARQLGTTKKAIIEGAIRSYAEKIEKENNIDVLEQTLGAWHRTESPGKTIKKVRKTFRDSMQRHQK